MLLPRVSLVLLELLQNFDCDKNCSSTNEINALHSIIHNTRTVTDDNAIETIAYFGSHDLMEPFISTLMNGTPKVIITQAFSSQLHFEFDLNFNNKIFFLAFGNLDQSSTNWQYLYDAFTSMQRHVRGVFVTTTRKGLSEHFDWCWRKGFLNVIALVTYKNQSQPYKIYTYTPLPTLNIIELVPNNSIGYFHNKLNDLYGYKIRTAVHNDPPRVIVIPNANNSNETLYLGYAARAYFEFLKYHNAGIEIVDAQKSSSNNILNVIEQLNQGNADLSMNPYLPYPGTRTSYPFNMIRWCILVPAKGEIDGYTYFLRPFHLNVWLLCIGMLFYLSIIKTCNELIDKKFHFTRERHTDFGHSFIEMMRLTLYLPTPQTYKHFRWHYAWTYGLVAIFGFMLSNLYLALLTSFLSKIIFEDQVNTLSEMVTSNMSIHAFEHEVPIILRNRGLPRGFADLLIPRNSTEMVHDVIALRSGQSYVAREDTVNFVLAQQSNLLRPRFRKAAECLTTIPAGFLMPAHSQYKNELDIFTLQIAAAGLLYRWYELTISDGFYYGILHSELEEISIQKPLSLEHFNFAYLVLMCGELLALFVFGVEQLFRFRIRIWLK